MLARFSLMGYYLQANGNYVQQPTKISLIRPINLRGTPLFTSVCEHYSDDNLKF